MNHHMNEIIRVRAAILLHKHFKMWLDHYSNHQSFCCQISELNLGSRSRSITNIYHRPLNKRRTVSMRACNDVSKRTPRSIQGCCHSIANRIYRKKVPIYRAYFSGCILYRNTTRETRTIFW